jgi:hypothetical protein
MDNLSARKKNEVLVTPLYPRSWYNENFFFLSLVVVTAFLWRSIGAPRLGEEDYLKHHDEIMGLDQI